MAESVHPARGGEPLATFAFTAGPGYGQEVPVPYPVVTLGRGADADVRIDDDSVSDLHARLEYDMGAWRLTDLESTNGTAVEGVKLTPRVPTPLAYGTTVRLGGVRMQFREVETADPEAARAGYAEPEPEKTLAEERTGFRFPLWLAFVLLVIAVAVAIILYMNFAVQTPAPVEEAPPTVPAAASGSGQGT
jgi:pSer/pThr/pTyr-binding forkhead associated (FHA) protein